jgi:hypothetical protein
MLTIVDPEHNSIILQDAIHCLPILRPKRRTFWVSITAMDGTVSAGATRPGRQWKCSAQKPAKKRECDEIGAQCLRVFLSVF